MRGVAVDLPFNGQNAVNTQFVGRWKLEVNKPVKIEIFWSKYLLLKSIDQSDHKDGYFLGSKEDSESPQYKSNWAQIRT